MGTRESLRSTVRRAAGNVADVAERIDTRQVSPAIIVIATSMAVLALAAVIGVVIYATRH